MKKLTKKEEELMKILWKLEKAFVKDIVELYPDPKPHYNTISSLVRLLQDKGVIGFTQYGNTYQYFPLISKEEYRSDQMGRLMKNYFDNSLREVVSFFSEEKNLDVEDVEEALKMLEDLKKKKKD